MDGRGISPRPLGGDPVALLHVLDTFRGHATRGAWRASKTPTLVLIGADDHDTGSGEALAAALPHGTFAGMPG